jgi:alkanesulfonate monooxygenase SsuD/methylene tetrahydromethanopterin reductase-like flavin-dependent oxidoreductase (luciferase family)
VPDYHHDLLFGIAMPPTARDHEALLATAELADDLGLDIVGIQDHPYQARFLDAWTLLSYVAGRTQHIRLFPNVANVPLRPPPVLARSAAALDISSMPSSQWAERAGQRRSWWMPSRRPSP